MNWIKENKFLSGVLAVVILGGGALGFLLYTAMGKFDEASTNFDQQASELHRLQTLPIYPSQKNVDKLSEQRDEYRKRVEDLRKSLEVMELPLEPLTPEQFQDRLKASVTAYDEKASAAHMKVPEKFFLGYEQYQSVPPRPEAAPLLWRELKAIEWVLGRVIEDGASELLSVKPDELPEEKGEGRTESRSRNGQPGPGPGQGLGGPGSRRERGEAGRGLRKSAFTVSFVSDEKVFQNILNEIVSAKSQYYIVRTFELKSTNEKPPMRDEKPGFGPGASTVPPPPPGAPAPDASNPAPAAGAPGAEKPDSAPKLGEVTKFVVGEEKVQVALLIEIVTFPTPPAEESKDGKPAAKPAPAP
jgi:hypothetical protein